MDIKKGPTGTVEGAAEREGAFAGCAHNVPAEVDNQENEGLQEGETADRG